MDGMGMIALQVCAQGNLSLLRRLLDTSPGVLGARDASGQTLLHVAAREGHLDVCSELVACNAECVTLLDDMGASASDVASSAAVRALLASAQPPSKPSAAARDPGVGDDNEEHDRPACAVADTPQLWSLPVDVCEIVLGFVAHGGLSSVLHATRQHPNSSEMLADFFQPNVTGEFRRSVRTRLARQNFLKW